jgi:hypothetical protein
MKRGVCKLSILLAALAAAPAAWSGAQIVKCVAPDGHVTLTDQPCPAGSTVTPVDTGAPGAYGSSGSQGATGAGGPAVEHFPAPSVVAPASRRAPATRKQAPRKVALTGDVATLKEAHAQLLLFDAAARPRLAAN